MAIVREVHGVPTWLLKEYLLELGGWRVGENQVDGEGWSATYDRMEDYRIGSIAIGRVRLRIVGDEQAIEKLMPVLELKLMRGGG